MLQQARQWRIRAAADVLELILAYAIDQKAKDREVLPGGDQTAERLQVALLVGATQDVRGVDADVASETGELAEVVDFLGGRASDNQLIDLARRSRKHRVD